MLHLPQEIIRYIYEFDNTYRCIFDKVLHSCYEIFQNRKTKNYFIFDQFSGRSFITDSLHQPTWKTTHYTHRNQNTTGSSSLLLHNFKKEMMNMYPLVKVDDNLKYDIHEPIYYKLGELSNPPLIRNSRETILRT
jgi:hypothetical protein